MRVSLPYEGSTYCVWGGEVGGVLAKIWVCLTWHDLAYCLWSAVPHSLGLVTHRRVDIVKLSCCIYCLLKTEIVHCIFFDLIFVLTARGETYLAITHGSPCFFVLWLCMALSLMGIGGPTAIVLYMLRVRY